MSRTLYEKDQHKVVLFTDLVKGDGIQANQLYIENHNHAAIFDPGGALTYQPLHMAISKMASIKDLDFVIATHQDPDIITSMDKWLMYTEAKIVISKLWERFLPHLVPGYMSEHGDSRIVPIPDQGAIIKFGQCDIKALPAHFLHSVGNFHFYDTTSKILFSGDMGASLTEGEHGEPVEDFERHTKKMIGFHQRYMVSNKACKLWANMIRELDVQMMVPQHGSPFEGQDMVNKFLDWISDLECGVDRITQQYYQVPA
ncbi:MAG: MBL fold metallo-hydrolase [Gammaproteobacteria bacterium]